MVLFSGTNVDASTNSYLHPQNLACADRRLGLPQKHADALVSHLLAQSSLVVQELANTAWSLVLLGVLQLDNFRQLLQRLQANNDSLDLISEGSFRQMYSALDWLTPPSGATSHQHKARSELQAELRRLGPRPQPKTTLQGSQKLKAGFKELELQCNLGRVVKGYALQAVVQPPGKRASPILLSFTFDDCFNNQPSR